MSVDTEAPSVSSPYTSPRNSQTKNGSMSSAISPGVGSAQSSARNSRDDSNNNNIPGWATPPKSPRSPFTSPKGSSNHHKSGGGLFSFDKGEGSGPSSPYGSPSRSRANSSNNLLSSMEKEAVHQDRFIPNRDSVDFDMAGHILHKADENYNGGNGINDAGNGLGSAAGTPTGAKASKIATSNSRTHLGVISNANNVSTPNRLLGSGKGRNSGKSSLDSAYLCDDGFTRLKEDKASNESAQDIATGAAAAVAAAAGMNIMGGISTTSPSSRGKCRHIPTQPSRILDAPDLMDDYYLNLLSWGSNNVIAVALNQSVYLWHASDGHIDNLLTLGDDEYVTSVQWNGIGAGGSGGDNTLAVGTSGNVVELWDASKLTKVRDLQGHTNRVSSLSWAGHSNPSLLSSGGRDGCVIHHDVRAARNVQNTLQGHTQEVCGLAWSPDGLTLASGGNENRLCLWDAAMSSRRNGNGNGGPTPSARESSPRFMIEQHNAAVKAVSWCPWQRNVLASGGGTADRTIRIWNASMGTNLRTCLPLPLPLSLSIYLSLTHIHTNTLPYLHLHRSHSQVLLTQALKSALCSGARRKRNWYLLMASATTKSSYGSMGRRTAA